MSQAELASAYQANRQVAEAIALLEQVIKIKRLKFHKGRPSHVIPGNTLSYFLQQT
jgi:hypothetical protein